MRKFSTAVTITDPLVKYRALVASGICSPDAAQHRLARHLQKIYLRIKDYSPQVEYRERLAQVALLTKKTQEEEGHPKEENEEGILALRHHGIWRNPLFKHLLPTFAAQDSVALTRVLKSHETAIEIDSPKGLFLSGEVGTGKSMLLDLLAEGLPTGKKKRWHFNTFMLYTISQLEKHRVLRQRNSTTDSEYSLLWLAKKLVDESPILFLDEFQLPDRAASKILNHLFIAFFQLGGVLVASSNRMPEELERATGIDYTPTSPRGLIGRVIGGFTRPKGELFGRTSDFANFLDVLKARCDFWQMEGAQDWRRRDENESSTTAISPETHGSSVGLTASEQNSVGEDGQGHTRKTPPYYFLLDGSREAWEDKVRQAITWDSSAPIPWEPSTLTVYGRKVCISKHYNGFVRWSFDELVECFGPADYITMASSYHTFIIDSVPILTILTKNEARRFITFLDAVYEARCKLIIRAQNPPDDLFFPKLPSSSSHAKPQGPSADDASGLDDATYSETIAEVYQDQLSPFRPNISFYDTQTSTSRYDPDQDSDFGLQQSATIVDFGNTSAFTGEDERFAYKRAASRLWEMCGARWHARTGDWWRPLPVGARHWEGSVLSKSGTVGAEVSNRRSGEGHGENVGTEDIEGIREVVEVREMAGLSKWRIEHLKRQSDEERI